MIGGIPTPLASLIAGAKPMGASGPANGAEGSPDFEAMLAMLGFAPAEDASIELPDGEAPELTGDDAPDKGEGDANAFTDAEPLAAAIEGGIGAVLALLAQSGATPGTTTTAAAPAGAGTLAAASTLVAQEIQQTIPQGLEAALAAVTRALAGKQAHVEPATAPAKADATALAAHVEAAPPAALTDGPTPHADMPSIAPSLATVAAFVPPMPSNDVSAPAPQAAAPDMLTHHLQVEQDGQWLDQLARDIARTAAHDSQLRFKLNPEHLGSLTVEVSHRAEGAAVRFTADSEAARTLIADAQPKLIAEARAQGLRIAEAHVDLGAQGGGGGQGRPQPWFEDQQPFLRTSGLNGDMPAESPAASNDDERYA